MVTLYLRNPHFTSDKDFNLPLHSAPSEEADSPKSPLFTSSAYQDLIERQPTHPDGPTLGWDLGLNLLGDRHTAAECKSLEDCKIKTHLRRLQTATIIFELLFGIWGVYTTVRYSLAVATAPGGTTGVFSLALGAASAIAVALIIISITTPLFPRETYLRAWRYTRSLLRACYLILLLAAAVMNLVLVLVWHPNHLCSWDMDISWYTSTKNTVSSSCHAVSFAAWAATAVLRLVVTSIMALLFIYTVRAHYVARHPSRSRRRPYHPSYSLTDPEDVSPTSPAPALSMSKASPCVTQSKDWKHTLIQSSTTLVESDSDSTHAPTSHPYSHSNSTKSISPVKTFPPTDQPTPICPRSSTEAGSEIPRQTQSITASPRPRMIRRSRISINQRNPIRRSVHDSSEINGPEQPTHHGIGNTFDPRGISLAWERSNDHGKKSSKEGESIKDEDDVSLYSYGYGASGPTYPYLEVYNSWRPGGDAEASRSDHQGQDVLSPIPRFSFSSGPVFPEVSESLSKTAKDYDSSEEEEYVPMMGGFVRRMATIESRGSKEAATLSMRSTPLSGRSQTPASQISSLRFMNYTPSLGSSVSGGNSLSTTYLSLSSGGTGSMGMRTNERGELLPESRMASPLSYGRYYYTASGQGVPG
ncbi:hypothetical protein BU15DRAFT_61960 [Melanogaster broomeanus]|nr:hypothetical protein BU15DRAFT_61960 [Melanogaster broomeanus]